MNASRTWLVAAVLAAIPTYVGTAAWAQAPADMPSSEAISKATSSLARVRYKVENELVSAPQDGGLAVCINAADGVFVTRDVAGQIPTDEMKQFKLSTSGPNVQSFNAELLGIDPETGIAFLQIYVDSDGKHNKAASHPWTEVKLEAKSELRLGQRVVSVGMMPPQTGTGDAPYLGVGTVSAILRLPSLLAYVSGDLTGSSSPVMNAGGKVIGMVGGQLPLEYRLIINGRAVDAGLIGRDRTLFFTPSEDFAHVLASPPAPGKPRKLAWMGVMGFQPVSPEMAELLKLTARPAVIVGQVMPDSAAGKAQIEQEDAIVAINDKPLERMATPELTAANLERMLVKDFKPGDKITVTIVRNGQSSSVAVTLGAMPSRAYEMPRYYNKPLGFGLRELTVIDRYANRQTPLKESGLAVMLVAQNSPAAKAALQPGDIITAVNKKPVPTAEEMKKVMAELSKSKPNADIELMVLRGDTPQSVVIKPQP